MAILINNFLPGPPPIRVSKSYRGCCPPVISKASGYGLPAQPIDATQALNLSAGVLNPKVFRVTVGNGRESPEPVISQNEHPACSYSVFIRNFDPGERAGSQHAMRVARLTMWEQQQPGLPPTSFARARDCHFELD